MTWNEPEQKDNPWNKNTSSPKTEELIRSLQKKWGGWFGKKGAGEGKRPSLLSFLPVLLLIGAALGIYIIEPAERAVILRFGKYHNTAGPGPHWRIPFVDAKTVVNVDQIRSHSRHGVMLTQDENIVDITLEVQYRIKDVKPYVLATRDPDFILKQTTESTLRQVIGQTDLNDVLTTSRVSIAEETKQHLQTLLDQYQTGLAITQVNMQKADPPPQVKEAFDDVIKAREDKVRSTNEAESYSNQILPLARGEAQRIIADAKGYKERTIKQAEGEATRFNQVLTEYQKAPEVTRERLYVETVESVLKETSKMILDTPKGSPLLILPTDKMTAASKMTEPSLSMSEENKKDTLQNQNFKSTPPEDLLRSRNRGS
ncbi:MAG: FtsH protease activity modulator HflK [Gammaproteobacteria bacterium]|nr:FtsH protease activity modulator HflK [Gammaproteobacteria bacterium]